MPLDIRSHSIWARHSSRTASSKKRHRKLHASINTLADDQVALSCGKNFPRLKAARLDEMAKAGIARAHRKASPRLPRKTS